MAMIVKFWGTRGATPVPGPATQIYGGNTPCVEIRTDKAVFICDGGSGVRLLSHDLHKRGGQPAVHLFISHLHPAHIQGLPFLGALFEPNARARVYADASHATALKAELNGESLLFPKNQTRKFCAEIRELNQESIELDGVVVRSFSLNHPGGCRGFSFEADGQKVVYIPDNELPIQEGDTFPDPRNEALLMRQMPRALLQAANGASLLIMDAQYTDEQYDARRGQGHSSCVSVTDFALQCGAHQLALFHHDPASSDLDLEERARGCGERVAKFGTRLTIFPAREGMALRL